MPTIAQADIEAIYGFANVARWSNFTEGASTVDGSRVTAAIAWSEDYVNTRLADGRYTIPLVFTSGTPNPTYTDIVAKLAGTWLYETRGKLWTEAVRDHVRNMKSIAEGKLNDVLTNRMVLPCQQKTSQYSSNIPIVV